MTSAPDRQAKSAQEFSYHRSFRFSSGRFAVWVRQYRYQRRHPLSGPLFQARCRRRGMGRRVRSDRMHCRCGWSRCRGRSHRLEERAGSLRRLFRAVLARDVVCHKPYPVCYLEIDWRLGNWRGFDHRPDVHRRDRPCPASRPISDFVSAGNRARHSGRCIRQHAHSTNGRRSLEYLDRLALDVFCWHRPRPALRRYHSSRC